MLYLSVARRGHACGLFKDHSNRDIIVVAGGFSDVSDTFLSSIEIMDVKEETTWKVGSSMFPSIGNLGSSSSSIMRYNDREGVIATGESEEVGKHPNLWSRWKYQDQAFKLIGGSLSQPRVSMTGLLILNTFNVGMIIQDWAGFASVPTDLMGVCQHTSMTSNRWVMILTQYGASNYFSKDEWNVSASFRMSRLLDLHSFRSCHGLFHFKLMWPTIGLFNEWFQASSPTEPGPVIGYQPLAVKFPTHFGGLRYANSDAPDRPEDHTLMSGATADGGGAYAVGRFNDYNQPGLPGPITDALGPIWVTYVNLYVKKDC